MGRKRIAVIGGGAAGLAASFQLSKHHDVTLFEREGSLGGHAHAQTLANEDGSSYQVDTAFLIFNDKTYSHFQKFLSELGVVDHSIAVKMSSGFSDRDSNLHFAFGNGLAPFLRNWRTLLRPELMRILLDLKAFRARGAKDLQERKNLAEISAADYLAPYSETFRENFVYPFTAAIWSIPPRKMRDYPVATLLRYFDNHQLLSGRGDRRWRTFKGSSAVYVNAFVSQFKGKVLLNTAVQSVVRTPRSVQVHLLEQVLEFDHVVLATHADISLKLLANPMAEEKRLLGAWSYHGNPVTLHRDVSVLHPDPRHWGIWNMVRENGEHQVSYWLNRLQDLPAKDPIILTLENSRLRNGNIRESLVIKRFNYRHPIFNKESIRSQRELPSLNGVDRIYFCGSYFGYGFHEDAVSSGFAAAHAIATTPLRSKDKHEPHLL